VISAKETRIFAIFAVVFVLAWFIPLTVGDFVTSAFSSVGIGAGRVTNSITESLLLLQDYARMHVLLCLVPAFFIAGAIAVFVSQASVMKYLGPKANKFVAYTVAAVSGTILAVCSCTILPLFAGIYRMGAGLGPASAFLYAGPAINVLAIILTARVLGMELGIARAVGAILFSVVIGLCMHFIFRKEENEKAAAQMAMPDVEVERPLWQNIIYFGAMVGVLVFANWGRPMGKEGLWFSIWASKWFIAGGFAALLAVTLVVWFGVKAWMMLATAAMVVILAFIFPGMYEIPFSAGVAGLVFASMLSGGKSEEWMGSTWTYVKLILPLLFFGVVVAGLLLGRPGHEALIPSEWVNSAVGGNSIWANLFASVAGAFMYFATLTEVPILQGLIGNGMGKGPALALLLAGPALSLPNMLVIRGVLGTKKTVVFVSLVIGMATVCGIVYGSIF
jgi:uncharacterized membrane protein YraQ (UPF0718 family)